MRTVASRFEARPVGQGAFIRGQVEFFVAASDSSGSIAPLRWIYDCGTESREDSIDASVDDLGVSWPKGSELDVLVVSHFDKDHISGLPTLLSRYRFKRIFMPQLPRLVRLLAVLEGIEAVAPNRMSQLLAIADDPISYVREHGGDQTQIVLVDAAEGKQQPEGEEEIPPVGADDLDSLREEAVIAEQTHGSTSTHRVVNIASGQPVLLNAMWELVPYIDSEVKKVLLSFCAADNASVKVLLAIVVALAETPVIVTPNGKPDVKASKALKKKLKESIKNLRDAVYISIQKKLQVQSFGKAPPKVTSKHKNSISLMAYMGPLFSGQPPRACTHVEIGVGMDGTEWSKNRSHEWQDGLGILLTGDSDLSKTAAILRLSAHLGPRRLHSLGILQVPHHGSKNNFIQFGATILPAAYSFINANPYGHHGHPDPGVAGYFKNSILVNSRAFEATLVASHYGDSQHPNVWHCQSFVGEYGVRFTY